MSTDWRCTNCGNLLGKGRETTIDLAYKDTRYQVDGTDFTITAICRKCKTENRRASATRKPGLHPVV